MRQTLFGRYDATPQEKGASRNSLDPPIFFLLLLFCCSFHSGLFRGLKRNTTPVTLLLVHPLCFSRTVFFYRLFGSDRCPCLSFLLVRTMCTLDQVLDSRTAFQAIGSVSNQARDEEVCSTFIFWSHQPISAHSGTPAVTSVVPEPWTSAAAKNANFAHVVSLHHICKTGN